MFFHAFIFILSIMIKYNFFLLLFMFLCALRIYSPEFIDDEFKAIYDIGSMLRYHKHFLVTSLYLTKKSFYCSESTISFDVKKLLVLSLSSKFTYVPHLLRSFSINCKFSNNCTINKLLIKNYPDQVGGCVYKMTCS